MVTSWLDVWLALALGSTAVFGPASTRAFSFSYSAPKSCDPFNVQWNGGTAPFSMLLTSPSSTPVNVSIPADSWNGSSGSYTATLNLTAGQSFVVTMSDVTGFGAGGNSDLLIVGGGSTSTNCNTTNPAPGFTFRNPPSLAQCATTQITGYGGATQPVQLLGVIPLGTSFAVDIPPDSTSYNWTVNVKSDTRVLFFIEDSQGKLSTTSSLQQVSAGGNDTCLDANSPHSTLSSATGTPTSTASSPTQSGNDTQQGSTSNNGAIIGGAVGGGIALLLIILLSVYCLWKRSRDPMVKFSKKRAKNGLDGMRALDLAPSTPSLPAQSPSQLPPLEFEPQPFILPQPASSSGGEHVPMSPTSYSGRSDIRNAAQLRGHNPRSPSQGTAATGSSSAAVQKAAMAGTSSAGMLAPPPRFVLHTDAGSVENANASTVELPPTYNAANPAYDGNAAPPQPSSNGASSTGTPNTDNSHGAGDQSTELHSQDHHTANAGSSTTNLTAPHH